MVSFEKENAKTMVGIVFGVVQEFQGKGIEGAMIKWTEENIVTQIDTTKQL